MNIYDYIVKNGDNKIVEINNLDALIFVRLSYLHIENIEDKLPISIFDLTEYLDEMKTNERDKKLVNLLKDTKRFRNLVIKRCESILNKENEEQFMAITIFLPKNSLFVGFRGTNKNIYGFKEDLNMCYKVIPSCLDGVKYLEKESKIKKIYVGGHSKGGHIAMYSAANANFETKARIIKVFNFDGPGFLEIKDNFIKMHDKIFNFFPEDSVVGRLLNNSAIIYPVKTEKNGIESHNLYHWMVDDSDFIYGNITKESDKFHDTCLALIKKIPLEKREIVINYFFSLMMQGKIKNIKDLSIDTIKEFIRNTPKLNKEEKNELMIFMKLLFKCCIPNLTKK